MRDNELEFSQYIVKNYDVLQKSGLLEIFNNMNEKLIYQNHLIQDACDIFRKFSIMKLINHVTNNMLNKFVPHNLIFFIKDEFSLSGVKIIFYQKMKLVEKHNIKIDSFEPYNKFFSLSPASITFEAFENMMGEKQLTNIFKPYEPEVLVPMIGVDGTYGFILLSKKVNDKDYSNEEKNYINIIMKFASICLQNIIHYQKASVDNKTKLYTYSFFQQKLSEEISRVKRYKSKFSILMLDIDHFKNFNDTYGHLIGDKILGEISTLILMNIRNEDIAARFGGEEFVIILIEATEVNANKVAERIRKSIEDYKMKYNKEELNVTISIGVSFMDHENILDQEEIIRRADLALYHSKTNGRNQTSIYKESY